MSCKTKSNHSLSSFHCFNKLFNPPNSLQSDKSVTKIATPKKVILSRKIHINCCHDVKSYSTGTVKNSKKNIIRPKKTTKSDFTMQSNKYSKINNLDCRKHCGDISDQQYKQSNSTTENYVRNENVASEHGQNIEVNIKSGKNIKYKIKSDKSNELDYTEILKPGSFQQYYKNLNFHNSDSMCDLDGIKKVALDTIEEQNEFQASINAPKFRKTGGAEKCTDKDSRIFRIYSDTEEEIGNSCTDNLKKLIKFRRTNYFECHSADSRVKNKGSVTSLKNHKCGYRFYLNDRLFPVPLNRDHNNTIRCIKCQLPLDLDEKSDSNKYNGVIQTKVKLGDENFQDLMLILPAREPLIIKEKRKERKNKIERDVVYFGLIKLSSSGDSVFRKNSPTDSLALRYQKGYREFYKKEEFRFDTLDKNDIIVI